MVHKMMRTTSAALNPCLLKTTTFSLKDYKPDTFINLSVMQTALLPMQRHKGKNNFPSRHTPDDFFIAGERRSNLSPLLRKESDGNT